MFEAVTMPSLMMMTSIVSKESFAGDSHRHRQTLAWSILNFFKVVRQKRTPTKSVEKKMTNQILSRHQSLFNVKMDGSFRVDYSAFKLHNST